MLKLTYLGDTNSYLVSFSNVSNNIVQITGEFPIKEVGFYLSREDKRDKWDYSEYKTVYKEIDGGVQFSNDGSVYVEPIPVVNFYVNGGGILDGEFTQEAKNYEDLIVPTPIPNEDYEFSYWSPEIPTEGKIEGNKSFTAIFTSTLPDPEPGPTTEERLTEAEERIAMVEEQNITLTLTMDSILTDVIPSLMQ